GQGILVKARAPGGSAPRLLGPLPSSGRPASLEDTTVEVAVEGCRPSRENGGTAAGAPAHARPLHSLLHDRLAGCLDDAGPDRKPLGSIRCVLHAIPIVSEICRVAHESESWVL